MSILHLLCIKAELKGEARLVAMGGSSETARERLSSLICALLGEVSTAV